MKAPARLLAAAVLAILTVGDLPAQTPEGTRPLDHGDYDRWNRIQSEVLSPDGRWVAYRLTPGDGDGAVVVRSLATGAEVRLDRGEDPAFTDDSRFLVVTVAPAEEAVEEAERQREEDRSVELPRDSLAILSLEAVPAEGVVDGSALYRAAEVASFRVPEEGPALVAWLLEPEEEEDPEGDEAQEEAEPGPEEEEGEEEAEDGEREVGSTLVLRMADTGQEHRFEHVTDYRFSEDGSRLYYTASSRDGTADGVFRVSTADGTAAPVLTGEGVYVQLAVSETDGTVAFLTDRDDRAADTPAFSLYAAGPDASGARLLVAPDAEGIPAGWTIGQEGEVTFSEGGSRIFFGTAPAPEPEEDEGDEDDEEEVILDVWHWQDDYLQPMQLVQARRDADRTWMATVPTSGGSVVQLETEELPSVTVADRGDGRLAMAETDLPYRQLVSWDGRYNDIWLIDVETGERRRVVQEVKGFGGGTLSPAGRFVTWWDGGDRHWYALDTDSGTSIRLTEGIPDAVHDELDDHPDEPPPYGAGGWTEDGRFVVYDAHDVWLVDPSGAREPHNVTEGVGRREGLRFRYVDLDRDEPFVPTDRDVLLAAFHLTEKHAGFYRDRLEGTQAPRELVMGPWRYGMPDRAEDADRLLLTRESFTDFPDLWVTGPGFENLDRVSEANPQQEEYRWGDVELVEWASSDGTPLQGLLYKPEGFDPSETYPMMVYFYERMSDGMHRYHIPAAGSSSINFSFYVSRDYLLFVPDIPYEIGHPGESALDAVVPGVLNLVAQGFVDEDRIGVQGHSWGGYQIAHMITRSNLFAAAEAGAPVSNMTSAYGGIRWGSGMSRMFQYERTQSRIGGTLWNAQHLYVANSPLFFADKIETPLLMMHNDEDGAVPWYQGIEMFVAMRRLGKPVWMLNYNGEDHGLRQEHNRKDWAIRMQQFFDHYLKGAPAPVWLAEGVPASMKGETLGLELVTEPEAVTEGGSN